MPADKADRRAADAVIRSLEERIHAGALADGERLPSERDLMEAYGISRTVVREAVLALAAKGLVETRPRARPVVRKPGYASAMHAIGNIVTHLLHRREGVEAVFDTRVMIEAALVRRAALEAGKDEIAELREALEANAAVIDDADDFYRTDVAFHGVLYKSTGNPIMPALHEAWTTWLMPQWQKIPRSPERNRANYLGHKAVFEAILMRDPDAAEKAMRAHLQETWARVSKTFEDL